MKEFIEDLVYGVKALLKASTAKEAIIALKKNKVELSTQIQALLVNDPAIKVFLVPDKYPMGWKEPWSIIIPTNAMINCLPKSASSSTMPPRQ